MFNAGKTPKAWNQKMLDDEHLKVLFYDANPNGVFQNTEIKGGVAVTYRDEAKDFGPIEIFTAHEALNSILRKVRPCSERFISDIVYSPESYKFLAVMYKEHPQIYDMTTVFKGKTVPLISKGHDYDLTSNIFEKLKDIVFFEKKPNDGHNYVQIFGRLDNARALFYIDQRYIGEHENLNSYKLFFPKSNGSGKFGEPMSASEIGSPGVGHTQTFLSMGAFDTEYEAKALMKYVQCKFARTLLGILKVTQDNKKSVWKYVPLQDFTPQSDIDWNKTIPEIDQQLYKKYGLSKEEIDFIETNVKEME
ncbi:MAG: Eco57I restriction-modification methylase domain-containing protein [Lachnospiraceae bacterium]|nr:Eco57I restriction-modification methylase domain-containing protein [Lachnospiraceae bacterium]